MIGLRARLLATRGPLTLSLVMPPETKAAETARVQVIVAGLKQAYPDAHCELNHSNPLELLIATILSAQCTDKRVNLVTAPLFQQYRSAADYAQAPLADLEQAIKSTGFFRNKARSVKTCCQALVENHGGQVPRTMAELTQLGGVGPQDGQRGVGQRLWHQLRGGGRYACGPAGAAAGSDKTDHAREDRAGTDGAGAAGAVDAV